MASCTAALTVAYRAITGRRSTTTSKNPAPRRAVASNDGLPRRTENRNVAVGGALTPRARAASRGPDCRGFRRAEAHTVAAIRPFHFKTRFISARARLRSGINIRVLRDMTASNVLVLNL